MSRSNQTNYKRVIGDRKAKMGFGKYKDTTVQDVLDNDPGYILWVDANIPDIEIACDVLTEAEDNNRPDHEFKNWTKREQMPGVNPISGEAWE